MKLQDKLSAMKQESMATMPPEKAAILSRATEDLVQSGIADKTIKVGEKLPGFSLPDEKGNLVNSKDLLARGPLAVSFYRGVW
ncbi:hypothetical protein [Desulfopila sp. IMCC35008]|uniref:hypothetical protein n=1 Tax=Desulfopila sp. IMCC35008 TaxID=2653858 RepID=UPI0013D47BD4|nr:hypothetical protein [Desulfopila sp. IMCC35008]